MQVGKEFALLSDIKPEIQLQWAFVTVIDTVSTNAHIHQRSGTERGSLASVGRDFLAKLVILE